MENGMQYIKKYKTRNKNNMFLKLSFKIIDNSVKIFKYHKFKIDSIEKNLYNSQYDIRFIYISKRQIFIDSASNLFKNEELINKFTAEEAAEIGFYHAYNYFEKINKI